MPPLVAVAAAQALSERLHQVQRVVAAATPNYKVLRKATVLVVVAEWGEP